MGGGHLPLHRHQHQHQYQQHADSYQGIVRSEGKKVLTSDNLEMRFLVETSLPKLGQAIGSRYEMIWGWQYDAKIYGRN